MIKRKLNSTESIDDNSSSPVIPLKRNSNDKDKCAFRKNARSLLLND